MVIRSYEISLNLQFTNEIAYCGNYYTKSIYLFIIDVIYKNICYTRAHMCKSTVTSCLLVLLVPAVQAPKIPAFKTNLCVVNFI